MFKGEPVALLTDTQGYEHESLILPVCLNPNLLFNRFFLSGKGGYPPITENSWPKNWTEKKLADIFRDSGFEPFARRTQLRPQLSGQEDPYLEQAIYLSGHYKTCA